jgi:hypothetical protein
LTHNLAKISATALFSVHLGNVHNANVTECDASTYDEVANLIEDGSPRAVFVVPGEEDWSNCPDPDTAWESWMSTFEIFNQRWASNVDTKPMTLIDGEPTTIFREKDQLENWAFVHKGVLFIGVHVVSGTVPDQDEFDDRNENNYKWVVGMSHQHDLAIRAVVIFGNGEPANVANQRFFTQVATFWSTFTKPILYLHTASTRTSSSSKTKKYQPFVNLPHVWVTQLAKTTENSPLRIQVGLGDKPFTIGY